MLWEIGSVRIVDGSSQKNHLAATSITIVILGWQRRYLCTG